jgi:hypothetical protein
MGEEHYKLPPPMPKDPDYVYPARQDRVSIDAPLGSEAKATRPGRMTPHVVAEVILHEGQLKEGRVQGFTIRCDEGLYLPGGTDTAPSPLGYFTTAIGF